MPRFPSAELQVGFIGSSNNAAIREAWRFYILMASRRKKYGLFLGDESHVLDFGCGWGRFSRMFLRDVPEDHIWCADSMELALDTCRETGVPGRMIHMGEMPPSDLPPAQFDTGLCLLCVLAFLPLRPCWLGKRNCPGHEAGWPRVRYNPRSLVLEPMSNVA